MKKMSLLFVLLASCFFVHAQKGKIRIGHHHQYHEKDTSRNFVVLGEDRDAYIQSLIKAWGAPSKHTVGNMVWENVAIEGLGTVPMVKLTDGIMTRNIKERSACFVPFKNSEDKQQKLATIKENELRNLNIEFCDSEGNAIIRSAENERISQAVLNSFAGL